MEVVWINGPFGLGKTTVAERLVQRLPAAMLYDPELVGTLLRGVLPPEAQMPDYQDIPLWRQLVRTLALQLLREYRRTLVVPMTLVVPEYFAQIVGGLRGDGVDVHHVALLASEETVLQRVRGSDRQEWAEANLDRCLSGLRDPMFARHIDANTASADEIAGEIASSLGLR